MALDRPLKPPVLLRLAVLLLAAGACAGCRRQSCERAVAEKNHRLAAGLCEQAYLKSYQPVHALATVRALDKLQRNDEVTKRLPWLKGTPFEPASYFYLGLAARAGDQPATATFERCVAEAPAAGLHDYAVRCARQLAAIQWLAGRFADAFATLSRALIEVRQLDDPIQEGMVHGQLADLLGEIGDEAGQGVALRVVADRFRSAFPVGYAQVRLRQGHLERDRGHLNIARDCFDEALGLASDAGLGGVVRSTHLGLAGLARSAQDFDGGWHHLAAAAAIPAGHGYEHSALAFQQARLLGDLGRWREAGAMAVAALDAGPIPDWEWQLKTIEGESLEQQGNSSAARAAYEEATRMVDSLRAVALRPGLLAERRLPYEALFELHLGQGDLAAAVEVMEQLLAVTFLERMAQSQAATADLETSARNAVRRLAANQQLALYQRAQPSIPLARLLERLGQREVLAFLTARGHLYRVHLAAGKLAIQQLEAAHQVRVKREHLEAAPDDPAAAEALGRALWPQPGPGPDLLIITDGSLVGVSFAGLRLNGRYLVEDHVVSYAPALTVAAMLQDRAPGGSGVVVLGDPKGNLPGGAEEARQAARRLKASPTVGPAATIARFREGCRAEVLHLAAHSGLGPEGAWLELADGLITAGTVLEERCGPPLVYLASCASAASTRKDGAGTLASAFLAAGSQFVVATTRSIGDSTAANFGRALFADGKWDQVPRRVARAQRALLKTAPRSAWEPFIVFGP